MKKSHEHNPGYGRYGAHIEMILYGEIYSVLKNSDCKNKQAMLNLIKFKSNILKTNYNNYVLALKKKMIKIYGENAKIDQIQPLENSCEEINFMREAK